MRCCAATQRSVRAEQGSGTGCQHPGYVEAKIVFLWEGYIRVQFFLNSLSEAPESLKIQIPRHHSRPLVSEFLGVRLRTLFSELPGGPEAGVPAFGFPHSEFVGLGYLSGSKML